jgi:hypothetical protein
MRNTADITGGKPIAVCSQSISVVRAINPLVAFYDIHGRKGEVLFFCSIPDTARDIYFFYMILIIVSCVVRDRKTAGLTALIPEIDCEQTEI